MGRLFSSVKLFKLEDCALGAMEFTVGVTVARGGTVEETPQYLGSVPILRLSAVSEAFDPLLDRTGDGVVRRTEPGR